MKKQDLELIFSYFRQYNKPFSLLYMGNPPRGKVLWPTWHGMVHKKWINGRAVYTNTISNAINLGKEHD